MSDLAYSGIAHGVLLSYCDYKETSIVQEGLRSGMNDLQISIVECDTVLQ